MFVICWLSDETCALDDNSLVDQGFFFNRSALFLNRQLNIHNGLGGVYLPCVDTHATCQLSYAIQVSVVVSPVIRVMSPNSYQIIFR